MTKPILFITAIAILAGCNSQPAPEEKTAATSPTKPVDVAVRNAPDANAAPGSAYRIVPPNPNDPRFRPDPKLAGGG